jgi:hypothetical protein
MLYTLLQWRPRCTERLTATFLARQALHAIIVIRPRFWSTTGLEMLSTGASSGVEIPDRHFESEAGSKGLRICNI